MCLSRGVGPQKERVITQLIDLPRQPIARLRNQPHGLLGENPAQPGIFLKDWRDQIIRDLAGNKKELPTELQKEWWADYSVNIDKQFEPIYVVPKEKQAQVKRLRDALNLYSSGREIEAIQHLVPNRRYPELDYFAEQPVEELFLVACVFLSRTS